MFLINYKDENNAGEAWRTRKNERKKEKKKGKQVGVGKWLVQCTSHISQSHIGLQLSIQGYINAYES